MMLYLADRLARPEATGRSASARCCSTPVAFVTIGIQLLSLGILAELVTAYNIRPEDTYSVVETIPAREELRSPLKPPRIARDRGR